MAYLIEPYARKGTAKSKFDLAPCSGGIKGQSKYLAQPGEKTEVEWTIQNAVRGGRCQIRLSRGHPDDIGSYHPLPVAGHGYDARTGTFNCGDPAKKVEEVKVQIPFDTTCTDCTLQWIYEAPGYGSLFQCADISIMSDPNKETCKGECMNGGVCQDNLCYCAAGFFGEYCQHYGKPNQFYEPVKAEGKPAPQPQAFVEDRSSKGGLGFFGWYFLLFFLSLVIAGIICALVFLLCRREAEHAIKKKKDDEVITGRGRGEIISPSEKSDANANRRGPDSNRRYDDDIDIDKRSDGRLNADARRDQNVKPTTPEKHSPDKKSPDKKTPESAKKENKFRKADDSFGKLT